MIAREDGCTGPLENRVDETMLESLPVDWDGYLNPDPMSVPKKYSPETSISQWCVAGRFPNILPNGDLVPCSVIRIPIGNLRESKFAELWSGSKLLDELRAIKVKDLECASCEYFPRCKPCVGIAYNESGSYFTKPLEYCRLTKKLLKKPVK